MLLPRLLQRIWSPGPGHLQHLRGFSYVMGSRFVSSPVDDSENSSVIGDFLEYGRKTDLNMKNKNSNTDATLRKRAVRHKSRKSKSKLDRCDMVVNRDNSEKIEELLKSSIKPKNVSYIIGQDAADIVVGHLKKDLREDDVIVESHLGLGILTKTLLEQTTHRIIGYEPKTEILNYLTSNLKDHADRVELHCLDLLKFYQYYMISKREPENEADSNILENLLQPLPVRGDRDVSPVKIIGTLSEMSTFHKLTLSFTFQCCFYEEIFPILYFYVPEKLNEHLVSSSSSLYGTRARIPSLFYFNIEHLDAVPMSNFYFKGLKTKNDGSNYMYLVKITPKNNIYDIPLQDLSAFHYFTRCLINARVGETFIRQVERWIPGCGIDFIKNGFRMFVHPRDLPPEKLLEAYKLFISLPSFKDCMFSQFCNNWTIQYGLRDNEIIDKMDSGDSSDKTIDMLDDFDIDEFAKNQGSV